MSPVTFKLVIVAFTFLSIFTIVSSEGFTGFKSCIPKNSTWNNTLVLKLPTQVPQNFESLLCQRQNQGEDSEESSDYIYLRSGYFSERLDLPIDGSDICPDFKLVPPEGSDSDHTNNCGVTPVLFQFSVYAPFSNSREDIAPWEKLHSSKYAYYTTEFLVTGPENCTFVIAQYRIDPLTSGCHEKVSQYCYTRAGPDTCEQEFYPQSIWYKQRNSVIAWKSLSETYTPAESTPTHHRRSNVGVRKFVGTFLILSVLLFYVKYGMLKRSLQLEENAASEAAERAEFDSVMSARRLVALNRFMDMGSDRRSLDSPYCSTSLLGSVETTSGCGGAAPPPRYPGHSVYISVDEDSPPTYAEAVALQK